MNTAKITRIARKETVPRGEGYAVFLYMPWATNPDDAEREASRLLSDREGWETVEDTQPDLDDDSYARAVSALRPARDIQSKAHICHVAVTEVQPNSWDVLVRIRATSAESAIHRAARDLFSIAQFSDYFFDRHRR